MGLRASDLNTARMSINRTQFSYARGVPASQDVKLRKMYKQNSQFGIYGGKKAQMGKHWLAEQQ
jgi:hypothetical protein